MAGPLGSHALASRRVDPVLVVGGSLAGMAAAARLAKAGHPVALWEASDGLGGHLAATSGPAGVLVDAAPAIVGFPAPWRDLFRKSGRTLEAELARTGAALAPAGPARYEFPDGSTVELPTDRGEQHTTLSAAYGERVALRWRDLLDWLDDVWQAVRPLGLERELTDEAQLSRPVRQLLRPQLSVADLAAEFDHPALGAILRASAYRSGSRPEQTPGWAAVTLSVERRFGRWAISTPADDPRNRTGRTSSLIDALVERLTTRKVDIRFDRRLVSIRATGGRLVARAVDGSETFTGRLIYAADPWRLADLVPWSSLRRSRRNLRRLSPAQAPQISHRIVEGTQDAVTETVRIGTDGVPAVVYRRPTTAGLLQSTHDFTNQGSDPAAGVAWHGFRSWFHRPPIRTELPGLFLAGPWTAAGAGLSPTVLAAALASYAAHE